MYTAKEVSRKLKEKSSPERARETLRFFKTGPGQYGEGDKFIGTSVPDIREISKNAKDIPFIELQKLVKSPVHEERLAGFIICTLKFLKAKKSEYEQERVVRFFIRHRKFLNNWDIIDVTVPKVLGEYFLKRERTFLYDLIRSKSLWDRRIAIMSTFTFLKEGDFEDTLNFCEQLLSDKEDLIHKASGWMLREVGKRDKERLLIFLRKHSPKMPRTMLRYSLEKLSPLEKSEFF